MFPLVFRERERERENDSERERNFERVSYKTRLYLENFEPNPFLIRQSTAQKTYEKLHNMLQSEIWLNSCVNRSQ